MERQIFTVEEVAKLGLTGYTGTDSIRKLINTGELDYFNLSPKGSKNRTIRIHKDHITNYLNKKQIKVDK